MKSYLDALAIYATPRVIVQFLLGIPSGLPLALTASTLAAWLSEEGISKASIGVIALVAIPYSLKFLWAPVMDGSSFPLLGTWLGRRRSWMLATQILMAIALLLMALNRPSDAPFYTGLFALLLAFASASHDIVKDAYRVEILPPELQGAGSASFVFGYRIGMIFATAGALYLATGFGWQMTYLILAGAMAAMALMVPFIAEPVAPQNTREKHTPARWVMEFVVHPFTEFMQRPQAITILLFILLYRMTDAFIGIMANPFYLELGFTKLQIAEVVKLYGLIATLVGSAIGGMVVYRLGTMRALWLGGLAAALSNLMFVWQAQVGAEPYALALTVTLDNLSGGLATAAFVAYMSQLCDTRFTATQFALLSSLAAVGRTWLTVPSGWAAETLGWQGFFILSSCIVVPALVVLAWLSRSKAST